MEFQDIIYTKEDGIATVTLNRPETLNALTNAMTREWMAAIDDAKRDDGARVLVVTGAGRGFCSGANPRQLAARRDLPPSSEQRDSVPNAIGGVLGAVLDFPKPYIGAINGPAVGGGMDLTSMFDIRIASDRARFGMTYIRMGVIPGNGGCYLLPRIVGVARAAELIWTGRIIDAEEALRIGYVSKVVPHDELMAATQELALQLARGPSVAIQWAKRLIYQCLELDLKEAFETQREAMAIVQRTEDAREGPRAWVEKREPIFKGR
jgi:2-(1,2-epoxy-1,2-dihydrophenyl)acetyl-CoA isomerase